MASDDPAHETLIRQRVAYDEAVGSVGNDPEFEASDAGFSKVVRLLRDTLGAVRTPRTQTGFAVESDRLRQLPSPFGRFEQPVLIGQGGFASVWRAIDPLLRRCVAIKVPHPEVRIDPQLSDRFLRESRAAARLNHPHIVRVHEAGEIDGIPYLASEFVAGESLGQAVQRGEIMPAMDAARMVAALADAIAHAHQNGVVHRDIKPDNILLESPPESAPLRLPTARLTDFGLARLADEETDRSRAGLLVGTPNYMAPEQIVGGPSARETGVDIYALGVVLYQLITGSLPRQSNSTVQGLVEQSLRIEPPQRRNVNIPADLAAICLRCLESDPARRYDSAAALHTDLCRFLDGRSTIARPIGRLESAVRLCRHHPTVTALVSTVIAALCAISLLTWRSQVVAATQNERLRSALVAGDVARQSAEENEQKYRQIAWNTTIQKAYRFYDEHDWLAASQTLAGLRAAHDDAVNKPEWNLLCNELARRFAVLHVADFPLRDLALFPDSDLVAVAGDHATIDIRYVTDGALDHQIPTQTRHIHAVAVDAAGTALAWGGAANLLDRSVAQLIDLRTRQITITPLMAPATIESLAFSPDGGHLAAGFRYEGFAVARLPQPNDHSAGKRLARLAGDRRNMTVQWTGDGQLIAQRDQYNLQIADVAGKVVQSIHRDAGFHLFAAFRDRASIVASQLASRDLLVINVERDLTELTLTGSSQRCGSIAVSADGRWIAAGQVDGQIAVWRLPNWDSQNDPTADTAPDPLPPSALVRLHEGEVTALSWQGTRLISVGTDGRLVRSNFDSPLSTTTESPAVSAAAFIPCATIPHATDLILGFVNGDLYRVAATTLMAAPVDHHDADIHRLCETAGERILLGSGNEITALAVADDGGRIAVGHATGELSVLRAENGETEYFAAPSPAPGPQNPVIDIAMGPQGNTVYWTSYGHTIRGISLDGSVQPLRIDTRSTAECIRVLPAGGMVAASGLFEGIRFYRTAAPLEWSRSSSENLIPVFVINSDGKQLISGNRDGTIWQHSIATMEQELVCKPHLSSIRGLALSESGKFGVSMDEGRDIVVWNLADKTVHGRISNPAFQSLERQLHHPAVALNSDESLLLAFAVEHSSIDRRSHLRLFNLRHATDFGKTGDRDDDRGDQQR
jgi:WD40 repeat protein